MRCPMQEWQFSHWEVSHADPQPTKRSNPMTLELEDVPVEVVIAHFEPFNSTCSFPMRLRQTTTD